MSRRKQPPSDFGERLAAIRRERGITQVQLAAAIGSTQRAISYYESETGHAPAPVIVQLADALEVSTDQLLGVDDAPLNPRAAPKVEDAEQKKLWKKFQRLLELPEKDRRAVIRLLNSLADSRTMKTSSRASR